jgi:hypothetical protein
MAVLNMQQPAWTISTHTTLLVKKRLANRVDMTGSGFGKISLGFCRY